MSFINFGMAFEQARERERKEKEAEEERKLSPAGQPSPVNGSGIVGETELSLGDVSAGRNTAAATGGPAYVRDQTSSAPAAVVAGGTDARLVELTLGECADFVHSISWIFARTAAGVPLEREEAEKLARRGTQLRLDCLALLPKPPTPAPEDWPDAPEETHPNTIIPVRV